MLFGYLTLKLIWWFMVGVVLVCYALTAGCDFGVTLLMPFMNRKATFAENDQERRVMLNVIAPTWDGNQTWLVFAGGALFVIWPAVYASVFSGLYLIFIFIVWTFALRPPGFDYRGKLPSEGWRRTWDWALFISAFFPVLAISLLVGNLFSGLPIHFDQVLMKIYYEGHYRDLFNEFALLVALGGFALLIMHGAAYLAVRTEEELSFRFARTQRMASFIFLIIFTACGVMLFTHQVGYSLNEGPNINLEASFNPVYQSVGTWGQTLIDHPSRLLLPLLVYFAIWRAMSLSKSGRLQAAYMASKIAVGGVIFTIMFTLFPFLVPSSYDLSHSLTLYNAASSHYTLMAVWYVITPCIVLIMWYKWWSVKSLWGRKSTLTVDDVNQHSHSYY